MGYYTNAQQAALYYSRKRRRDLLNAVSPSIAETLFPLGEEGILLDPSQLDTLYQSVNAEAAPVATDGDSVGIAMDVRTWAGKTFAQIMDSQPELWDHSNVTLTGEAEIVGENSYRLLSTGAFSSIDVGNVMAAGELYRVTFDLTSQVSGSMQFGNVGAVSFIEKSTVSINGVSTASCFFKRVAACDIFFENVSVKKIPGNHMVQATALDRPVYKTAGGKHWLEADGVNHWMQAAFTLPQPWNRYTGLHIITFNSGDNIYYGVGGSKGTLQMSAPSPNVSMYNTAYMASVSALIGADIAWWEKFDGAASEHQINDNTLLVGSTGATDATQGWTLFASNTGSVPANVRFYGGIMRSEFTAAERAIAKEWITDRITP